MNEPTTLETGDGADLDLLDPSEADIAAVEDDVSEKELIVAFSKEGLGKEGKKDDVRHMLDSLCQTPLLSRDEEIALATRIAQGDAKARNRMILANQRLVISIAKRYRKLGMDFTDLVHEGNIGLMRAVDKYDVERGFKFCTYATWWIRQAIFRGLSHSTRSIRIPEHAVQMLYTIRKAQLRIEMETGKDPSNEELETATGIPADEIRFLKKARKHPERLNRIVGKANAGDGAELQTLVADDTTKEVDVRLHADDIRGLILEALRSVKRLEEKDIKAFLVLSGLEDGQRRSMKETAKSLERDFTKVRSSVQLVRRALRKFPQLALLAGIGEEEAT